MPKELLEQAPEEKDQHWLDEIQGRDAELQNTLRRNRGLHSLLKCDAESFMRQTYHNPTYQRLSQKLSWERPTIRKIIMLSNAIEHLESHAGWFPSISEVKDKLFEEMNRCIEEFQNSDLQEGLREAYRLGMDDSNRALLFCNRIYARQRGYIKFEHFLGNFEKENIYYHDVSRWFAEGGVVQNPKIGKKVYDKALYFAVKYEYPSIYCKVRLYPAKRLISL